MNYYNKDADREFGKLEAYLEKGLARETAEVLVCLINDYNHATALFFAFYSTNETDGRFKDLYLDLAHRARKKIIEDSNNVIYDTFVTPSLLTVHNVSDILVLAQFLKKMTTREEFESIYHKVAIIERDFERGIETA